MKKITFYSNDQIIFNPDCVFIERGKMGERQCKDCCEKRIRLLYSFRIRNVQRS